MTKSYAAEALDEARRVESQLDWLLFANEQDMRLFGDPMPPALWSPGDPLNEPPETEEQAIARFTAGIDEDSAQFAQIVEYIHDYYSEEQDGYWYDDEPDNPRCIDCDVTWIGADPCFVCGVMQPSMPYFDLWMESDTSARWSEFAEGMAAGDAERLHQELVTALTGRSYLETFVDRKLAEQGHHRRNAALTRVSLPEQITTYRLITYFHHREEENEEVAPFPYPSSELVSYATADAEATRRFYET